MVYTVDFFSFLFIACICFVEYLNFTQRLVACFLFICIPAFSETRLRYKINHRVNYICRTIFKNLFNMSKEKYVRFLYLVFYIVLCPLLADKLVFNKTMVVKCSGLQNFFFFTEIRDETDLRNYWF